MYPIPARTLDLTFTWTAEWMQRITAKGYRKGAAMAELMPAGPQCDAVEVIDRVIAHSASHFGHK